MPTKLANHDGPAVVASTEQTDLTVWVRVTPLFQPWLLKESEGPYV